MRLQVDAFVSCQASNKGEHVGSPEAKLGPCQTLQRICLEVFFIAFWTGYLLRNPNFLFGAVFHCFWDRIST